MKFSFAWQSDFLSDIQLYIATSSVLNICHVCGVLRHTRLFRNYSCLIFKYASKNKFKTIKFLAIVPVIYLK